MTGADQAGLLVHCPQRGYLQPREPAEQQGSAQPQRAADSRRQGPERRFQDIGDHEIEARAPMIGCFGAEMDFDPMSIERGVRVGAGQRNGIDIGTDYEACATRARNTGKQPRTGSYIQYRFRLPLPAIQINSRRAQACRRVRSIPEDDRVARDEREQGQSDPAGLDARRRRSLGIQDNPGSDPIHEESARLTCGTGNPKAILT